MTSGTNGGADLEIGGTTCGLARDIGAAIAHAAAWIISLREIVLMWLELADKKLNFVQTERLDWMTSLTWGFKLLSDAVCQQANGVLLLAPRVHRDSFLEYRVPELQASKLSPHLT